MNSISEKLVVLDGRVDDEKLAELPTPLRRLRRRSASSVSGPKS